VPVKARWIASSAAEPALKPCPGTDLIRCPQQLLWAGSVNRL